MGYFLGMSRHLVFCCCLVAAAVAASSSGASEGAACTASQLRLSSGGPVDPATGEHVWRFDLRNGSSTRCHVEGYPGVRLLNGAHVMPFTYHWGGTDWGTRGRPRRVELLPGSVAWFIVGKYRCDGRELQLAKSISVIAPNTSTGARLRLPPGPFQPGYAYCKATTGPNRHDPGNTIEIGPLHPRTR
jgi:hypothetical protein